MANTSRLQPMIKCFNLMYEVTMNRFQVFLTIVIELMLVMNIILTIVSGDVSVLTFVMTSIIAMIGALPPSNRGGGRFA